MLVVEFEGMSLKKVVDWRREERGDEIVACDQM